MKEFIGLFVIFTISSVLFFVGYNATFNTKKTISKNMSLARYSEDSEKYKRSMSDCSLLIGARFMGLTPKEFNPISWKIIFESKINDILFIAIALSFIAVILSFNKKIK